MLIVHMVR